MEEFGSSTKIPFRIGRRLFRYGVYQNSFRTFHSTILTGGLFYAVGGREVTREVREGFGCRDVDAYDPVTNQWQKRSALIYPRHRPGVAVLDGYLYAVGGVVDKSHRNSVERYNPERDQWELVASMSCPRVGVAAAVMNRLLYAIGGLNETEKLSSVECFHPERNEWITLR